ncbi:MAG TPA: hypothetical protein VJ938_11015, partial [Acidimicrobiia bacterium]|nr:hypothetical protein [Acidimicrobiia bacterium]
MDIHERLAAHLKSEMARAPQPNPGAVMDRGDEIKSRRRLLVMAVPVAAVGILIVGVMALRPDPGGALLANPSADDVAAANAALSVGETIYDWETEPASLGWTMQQSVSDGVMYALSTAPGTRWEQFPNGDVPEAIYTSTDGLSWTSHLAESTWMNSIAATDGLLYAVGTAPGAEADSITVQVGVSSDMGETFTTTGLPFAVPAPGFTDTRVLANSSGVLALVTHTASTDPWSLIPSEELEGNVEPLVLQDGIAVFPSGVMGEAEAACFSGDAAACEDFVAAEATYDATWEELGLGEDVFFGEQTTQAAYFSGDGVDFEEIDYPLPDGWIEKAVTVADSAVVSISGGAGSNLLASKDLRSWQPVAAEFGAGWILDIGQVDDTVVAVGSSPQGDRPVVYRADDLYGAWSEVRVGDLLPP